MDISSGSQPIHMQSCTPPKKSGPRIHSIVIHAYQKPPRMRPTMLDFITKPF